MNIQVAMIQTKYGENHYADKTEEGLEKQIADFCDEFCGGTGYEGQQVIDLSECKTNKEKIEKYFDEANDDYLFKGECELAGAILNGI